MELHEEEKDVQEEDRVKVHVVQVYVMKS